MKVWLRNVKHHARSNTTTKSRKTTEKQWQLWLNENSCGIHWNSQFDETESRTLWALLSCFACSAFVPIYPNPLDPSIASINTMTINDSLTNCSSTYYATMTMWYHLVFSQKNNMQTHPQTFILTQLLQAFFASSSSSRSRLIFASSRMSSWEITLKLLWANRAKTANGQLQNLHSKILKRKGRET